MIEVVHDTYRIIINDVNHVYLELRNGGTYHTIRISENLDAKDMLLFLNTVTQRELWEDFVRKDSS